MIERESVRVLTVGLACLDYRFSVQRFPPPLRRQPVSAYREALGGPAATAAAAVVGLGGRARLCGRRGDDPVGRRVEELLRSEGVETQTYRAFPGARSPVSAVFVTPDGERFLFPFRGEDLPADADWVPSEVLDGAEAVLADLRWCEGALAIARRARERAIPVLVDLDQDCPEAWALLEYATHAVADEDLARRLGGIEALMDRLRRLKIWGAVTVGAGGVFHAGGHMPAFGLRVVDTTGAGDVFHGAFALALAQGQTEIEGLRFASAAAGLRCHLGEVPSRSQVDGLLNGSPPFTGP